MTNAAGEIVPAGFKVNGTPRYPVRVELRKSILERWTATVKP